jgi:hypothetical protein
MRAYHDEEWGVPQNDSRALWEALMLDGFQAGLSWAIILRKRDAFRKAFRNFVAFICYFSFPGTRDQYPDNSSARMSSSSTPESLIVE